MRHALALLAFLMALWAGRAEALPCALPYVLQNGTIPDAVQVMADFYALLNCVNGTGAGGSGIQSIAMTVPVELTVAETNCTGGGPACVINVGKAIETANSVWAGPPTGPGAQPTFRTLVAADIPPITCALLPAGGCPFDIVAFQQGVPGNSAVIRVPIMRAVSCPAAFTGGLGTAKEAATAMAVVNVNQITAGVSTTRGTFTWAAAGTAATLASASGMTLAANDTVEFAFPVGADATLGDVMMGIKCSRT